MTCLVPIPGIILTIMLPPLLCFWPIFYWFFSIIYPVECNLTITQFNFFFMIVLKTLFTISPVCVFSFAAISFDLGWLSPSETTVDLKRQVIGVCIISLKILHILQHLPSYYFHLQHLLCLCQYSLNIWYGMSLKSNANIFLHHLEVWKTHWSQALSIKSSRLRPLLSSMWKFFSML